MGSCHDYDHGLGWHFCDPNNYDHNHPHIIIIIIIIITISFSEPTILGFNEPNHADQSNLDPETAAYSWLELQQAYPDKVLKMIGK